ncbi:unnamed protein product [Acanthoscelides obtectus]|uniref:Lipocalin/cytosolic fatty-acid binding domain-containing protein n=1 Tax=Acanthoscelides obtectus TaxID=200917 RepID=A0A9P0K0S4_ACAOB|nr:unnamed protein product [Acanthoscelides obtectus]CAK1653052.1 hypothetical protein AOBTE_LOCUS18035 [Acanthoscelides obtectus]
MISHLVLVFGLFAIASAQRCLDNPPSLPLDVEKFSGTWYAQHRFGRPFVTPGCFRANCSATADNGYTALFEYNDGLRQNQTIYLVFEPKEHNRFLLTFNGTRILVSYLAVDYDSYAVFYDCVSDVYFSYVLTRSKTRDDAVIERAITEARKVQPKLPSPSKELNCDIF